MRFKKVYQKVAVLGLTAFMFVGALSGCGNQAASKKNDGKVTISVGGWPSETDTVKRESYDKRREEFMEKYPDIVIEPDTWGYNPQTFMIKASGNQLPTLYSAAFTEAERFKNGEYAADITSALEENGILDAINPDLLAMVTDENGRVRAWPREAYAQGLFINKSLFKEAGLTNEDGSVKIPETYQQLAEYAATIREKTGRAGLVFPTTKNCGGWNFLNIAWSFGADFEQQLSDGKWKAIFDTPEFKNALQYVYDLKWKYNALQDDLFIDAMEQRKQYGTAQAAMTILDPASASGVVAQYGMNKDDVMAVRLPGGEYGRLAQMGGAFWVVNQNATPEQIDACVKWLEFSGLTPEVTENSKKQWSENAKVKSEQNALVFGRDAYMLWINPDLVQAQSEAEAPYVNVSSEDFADYFSFEDVTIRPEPAVSAQELYSVLDKAIQSVITDENADLDAITSEAVNSFQKNYLDKLD